MKISLRPILVGLIVLAAVSGFAQQSKQTKASGQAKGNAGSMGTQPVKGRQAKSPMSRQQDVLRLEGNKQLVFEHDEAQQLRCRILDQHGQPAPRSFLTDPDSLNRVLGAMGQLNHAQQGAVLDELMKHNPHDQRIRTMRTDHGHQGSSGHAVKGPGRPPTAKGGSGQSGELTLSGSRAGNAPSNSANQKEDGGSSANSGSNQPPEEKSGSSSQSSTKGSSGSSKKSKKGS